MSERGGLPVVIRFEERVRPRGEGGREREGSLAGRDRDSLSFCVHRLRSEEVATATQGKEELLGASGRDSEPKTR